MKLFAVVLILLGVANNHPANGTFLFHNPQTGTGSVIAATIGLPRGGGGGGVGGGRTGSKQTSAPKKQTLTVQSMKKTLKAMIEQPSSGSTLALGQSLILYLAGMLTLYGVNKIRDLYPQQSAFFSGKGSTLGRVPAYTSCQQKQSILYAWPGSVSESLGDLNGITAKVVGSYLTFSALLILSSQLGRPSAFPIKAGHLKSIFNVVRMIVPTIALFFIPRVNYIGFHGIKGIHSPGQNQQANVYHTMFSGLPMLFTPLLEMIVVVHNLISFFKDSKSNNFFPSDNNSDADSSKAWVGTLYKSLWVGLTVLRGAMCVVAVWIALNGSVNATSGAIQTDACGVLVLIKAYFGEVALISLVGGIFAALALTQMCESSGRNLFSLVYLVPFLMFFSKLLMQAISTFLLTFDMKKNYLAIVNMPGGRFSEAMMSAYNSYLGQLQSQDGTVTTLPTGTTPMSEYKDCTAKFPSSELDMCP